MIVSNKQIRIGIDGRVFEGNISGVGRYITEICKRLDVLLPNAIFYVYSRNQVPLPVTSDRWIPRITEPSLGRKMKSVLWLKLSCGNMVKRDNLDIFWATCVFFPPLAPNIKKVVTVYDLNHIIVPDTMTFAHRTSYRLFFQKDIKKADTVITISGGTTARLKHLMELERVKEAIPGVDDQFRLFDPLEIDECKRKWKLPNDFLLSVSTLEPRKNQKMLIHAFIDLVEKRLLNDSKLVLIGSSGWKDQGIKDLLSKYLGKEIIYLGYIEDYNDLPPIFAAAQAFVFPSLYEGFGMPVAESRACGTPVVATDIPELREAGGPHGIYVRPNIEDLKEGILKAVNLSYSKENIRAGLYKWSDSAAVYANEMKL